MTVRRVTRALVALLLFHLTWVGDASACADRVDAAASGAAVATASHGHHEMPADAEPPGPASDELIVDRCCAAMATCALILIPTDGSGRVEFAIGAGTARPNIHREPTSGLRAPEPPPPRA